MFQRIVAVMFAAGLAAACTGEGSGLPGTQLQQARGTPAPTDPYSSALFQGYLRLAAGEYHEGDYRDSDFFARRAVAAAGQKAIEPQLIDARDLPIDQLENMASARRRIIGALYFGAASRSPEDAADAQLGFDCWMQELEENFQARDIEVCRTRFERAMARLEAGLQPAPLAARPAPSLPERLLFEVFFAFDDVGISPAAQEVIDGVAEIAATLVDPVIAVVGYADRSGPAPYNLDLSMRRAEAVAAALKVQGVEAEGVFAGGEAGPRIVTGEPAAAALYRRVVVVVR